MAISPEPARWSGAVEAACLRRGAAARPHSLNLKPPRGDGGFGLNSGRRHSGVIGSPQLESWGELSRPPDKNDPVLEEPVFWETSLDIQLFLLRRANDVGDTEKKVAIGVYVRCGLAKVEEPLAPP
ncbi:hypothetical protein PG993_000273 [Apiospora rasikravindrae]|uniref:Uncharacterized protein n=1 Tax=Apiospora rasikravindrae TaxID=990691 RepID=A0ABR1U809_9PEZI